MVQSHGGISGGLSIADALREFEARGYIGQFVIRSGGLIECSGCGHAQRPKEVPLEAMRRLEGVSDPADMVFVGALHCAECGTRGTAIVNYGPTAPASHAEVLRGLDDQRHSSEIAGEYADRSLVRDTGWLKGPENG